MASAVKRSRSFLELNTSTSLKRLGLVTSWLNTPRAGTLRVGERSGLILDPLILRLTTIFAPDQNNPFEGRSH